VSNLAGITEQQYSGYFPRLHCAVFTYNMASQRNEIAITSLSLYLQVLELRSQLITDRNSYTGFKVVFKSR